MAKYLLLKHYRGAPGLRHLTVQEAEDPTPPPPTCFSIRERRLLRDVEFDSVYAREH